MSQDLHFFPEGNAGTLTASGQSMRQSVFAMEALRLVGETGVLRKKERRARGRRLVFGSVRSVFAFLFVATALVFTFCNRADLQDYIFSNFYKWSQTELKSSSLRQNALNHENEVNLVLE
jgi:membrane-anchored protein YejM (alkaline phosphatase superfamily)